MVALKTAACGPPRSNEPKSAFRGKHGGKVLALVGKRLGQQKGVFGKGTWIHLNARNMRQPHDSLPYERDVNGH